MPHKKKRQPEDGTAARLDVAPPNHHHAVAHLHHKSAHEKQDDQVMATNNSSIVSKRSVEKLYYPEEPHFFRFFVKKLQRRAPLINRGYYFRMRVIDVLVRDFLRGKKKLGDGGKEKRKVVVNLGCGSDVLPWQCLTRYPDTCDGVKFIDVDFPDLIERKHQTMEATSELRWVFSGVKAPSELSPHVVFESNEYVQIGCDLRQLNALRKALDAVVDVENCEFIFVAEVSITYMETEGADGVIQWASSLGDAEFVLLEQILPEGDKHPFAATMLGHFRKLNTQLKSVHTYPTLDSQLQRFSSRGWSSVTAWTLWQAWADDTFLSAEDRCKLDDVEPFDEWEEFAIFGGHYCVIHAKTAPGDVRVAGPPQTSSVSSLTTEPAKLKVQFDECTGQRGQRRFAAGMLLPSENGKGDILVNALGLGTKSRLQSCDVFSRGDETQQGREFAFGDGGPATRMCHTLTDLGDSGVLLAGGRASPTDPFKDSWIFDRNSNQWNKTHDLPTLLYRHSVTSLGQSGLALLAGGRGEGTKVLGDFLLYTPEGWVACEVVGEVKPLAVYGATLASRGFVDGMGRYEGIFSGGIKDGLIARQSLAWELDASDLKKPTISFKKLEFKSDAPGEACYNALERFGATAYSDGEVYRIIGGVVRDELLPHSLEILQLQPEEGRFGLKCSEYLNDANDRTPRPLLSGTSVVPLSHGEFAVIGGGATCFSMGTFWNTGVYTFRSSNDETNGEPSPLDTVGWAHEKTIDIIPGERSVPLRQVPAPNGQSKEQVSIGSIPRVKLQTANDFTELLRKGEPAVIEGLDLGSCVCNWTLDYLVDKVGHDRKVVIHESTTKAMNFSSKNFRYITLLFSHLIDRIKRSEKVYLRALSSSSPTEKPALLSHDFPNLSPDFTLPPALFPVATSLFSSVLRLSGPVNMWLHYDVMANIYCQISGSKRLILFPPSDVQHLSFPPGASSSSIDVFSSLSSPQLAVCKPRECTLAPGEVLFLPPLWLHTATPTSEWSVAVNVFFKDLEGGAYAAGRDVYGNRDLAAYERGRQDVARIVKGFDKMPEGVRGFYLVRLAEELRRAAGV